ncbi:MAG: hypothetical protein ACYTA3_01115 [Planctomycetota bacterium]|jgi:hypothetical protein
MKCVQARFSSKRQGWPAVAVLAAVGLALACSESPTSSDIGGPEQAFFKGKPSRPPQQQDVTVTIVDPLAGLSGVFSDGTTGSADYTTGDPGNGNLNLRPECADPRRDLFLGNLPQPPAMNPFPVDNAEIPTCNNPGWMFLHLPEIMTFECPGDVYPCEYGAREPSYVIRGGRVKPTGWMSPTVNFFFSLDGVNYNLVWQDARLHNPPGGARRVTGGLVHLYDSTMDVLQSPLGVWGGNVELDVTVAPQP